MKLLHELLRRCSVKSLKFLSVIAASLLMSACQSTPRIVPVSLTPPLVCMTRCQLAAEPPLPNDDIARKLWEVDLIAGYGHCRDLHDDCIEALKKRWRRGKRSEPALSKW